MPRLNGVGPDGQGAMTGRRMGHCTNFSANQKSRNSTKPNVLPISEADSKPGVDQELGGERGFVRGSGRGLGRGLCRGAAGCGLGRQNRFRGGF